MSSHIESNKNPLITIIIATYNDFINIQQTLDSIKNQKYKNTEVIVIDGNSDDGTIDILSENSEIITQWLSEEDLGIYDAWNKGLELSSGDWVMFLGAGDCLNSNALESYIFCINSKNNSVNFVSSRGVIIDSKGKHMSEFGKRLDKRLFLKNMAICHPSSLHHKSLYLKYGYYDISYKISSDYDFLLRALKSIHPKFIDEVLVEILDGGISTYSFDGLHETRRIKLLYRSRVFVDWEWIVSVVKLYIKLKIKREI